MSASNYRKALWPAWSGCSVPRLKQSPADCASYCAGAATNSTEPSSPKLYLPQILVWFCGKNNFWKCLSRCQLRFSFTRGYYMVKHIRDGWMVFGTYWTAYSRTSSWPKLGTCITEVENWCLVSPNLMTEQVMCGYVCPALYSCILTYVFYVHSTENNIANFGWWCWDSQFALLPPLCSARSKGCKTNTINTEKLLLQKICQSKPRDFCPLKIFFSCVSVIELNINGDKNPGEKIQVKSTLG